MNAISKPLMLLRKIELLEGNPVITVKCRPAGNYGEMQGETVVSSNHLRYLHFDMAVRLTTDVPLSYIQETQAFVLNQNRYLVFTYGDPLEAP
jgi:hypothetical protein